MIHLGDITKINGGTAPVVDAVIGGSPCQDLSIAGKRAGLSGGTVGTLHGADPSDKGDERA